MKYSEGEKTQILATAGPTLRSVEEIVNGINAGATNFRLHLGSRDRDAKEYIQNIRDAEKITNQKVEILLDLPSSRPRVALIPYRELEVGEKLIIIDDPDKWNRDQQIPIPGIVKLLPYLKKGERMLFRDGKITLLILEVDLVNNEITTECTASSSRIGKGCSCVLPDSDVTYDSVVDEDINTFTKIKNSNLKPDWIAISFATNYQQIEQIREICNTFWPESSIGLIAKIENNKGISNIEEILNSADGIMIGRGDLALHTDPIKLPAVQSYLLKKSQLHNKLCIVATEFLENFANSNVVNRAELNDIANAVRQNASALMLSMESANSSYPIQSISLMKKIIDIEYSIQINGEKVLF